jgi:hypothetical protein
MVVIFPRLIVYNEHGANAVLARDTRRGSREQLGYDLTIHHNGLRPITGRHEIFPRVDTERGHPKRHTPHHAWSRHLP